MNTEKKNELNLADLSTLYKELQSTSVNTFLEDRNDLLFALPTTLACDSVLRKIYFGRPNITTSKLFEMYSTFLKFQYFAKSYIF